MKQLIAQVGRDRVSFRDRQIGWDDDVHLRMQAVPEPAGPNIGDLLHLRDVACRMANFFDNVGVDPVTMVANDCVGAASVVGVFGPASTAIVVALGTIWGSSSSRFAPNSPLKSSHP